MSFKHTTYTVCRPMTPRASREHLEENVKIAARCPSTPTPSLQTQPRRIFWYTRIDPHRKITSHFFYTKDACFLKAGVFGFQNKVGIFRLVHGDVLFKSKWRHASPMPRQVIASRLLTWWGSTKMRIVASLTARARSPSATMFSGSLTPGRYLTFSCSVLMSSVRHASRPLCTTLSGNTHCRISCSNPSYSGGGMARSKKSHRTGFDGKVRTNNRAKERKKKKVKRTESNGQLQRPEGKRT